MPPVQKPRRATPLSTPLSHALAALAQNTDIADLFALLGPENLRFVGGCVRNTLLGRPLGDIDFATPLSPNAVIQKLTAAGIKIVPTGIDHGTVTAVLNGVGYEITTLRQDVATDGRRATVAFTTDWAFDAARRDFTVNALYADLHGLIYDPLGTGFPDIARRKIRFIGDAATRIREDALRILRFFRFQTYYGRGRPDAAALNACTNLAPLIRRLSRERVSQEFFTLFAHPRAGKMLLCMAERDILPAILPRKLDTARFDYIAKLQEKSPPLPQDVLLATRLYALGLRWTQKSANNPIPLIINKKTAQILNILRTEKIKTLRFEYQDLQLLLYRHGHLATRAVLDIATALQPLSATRHQRLVRTLAQATPPVFPVTGKDIMAQGIPAGPTIGLQLNRLEKRWIRSAFSLTKEDLLKNVPAPRKLLNLK